jgi:hypothetical protein
MMPSGMPMTSKGADRGGLHHPPLSAADHQLKVAMIEIKIDSIKFTPNHMSRWEINA